MKVAGSRSEGVLQLEPIARATPRTACTEPKCLCTPRRSTAGGQTASSRRPGGAAGSASRRAICISRPADLAGDTGLLAIPAAFAAPPEQGAPAHLVPAREEHQNNDHANQRNTHPCTSWRAELLRRGVGSAWGENQKWSSCPNKASLPRRDSFQRYTGKSRSLSGPAQVTPAPAGGAPRPRRGASCCERWPIGPSGQLPSAPPARIDVHADDVLISGRFGGRPTVRLCTWRRTVDPSRLMRGRPVLPTLAAACGSPAAPRSSTRPERCLRHRYR